VQRQHPGAVVAEVGVRHQEVAVAVALLQVLLALLALLPRQWRVLQSLLRPAQVPMIQNSDVGPASQRRTHCCAKQRKQARVWTVPLQPVLPA
jgi:hypothetical protein